MIKKTIRARIVEFFAGNLSAKLMALAMAVALWFYAFHFSQVVLTSSNPMRVPVNILGPNGWSVAQANSRRTDKIDIIASYPRRNEAQIEQALRDGQIAIEMVVEADEDGRDEQEKTVALTESNLRTPKGLGIRPLGFDPPELTLRLIRETTMNVRVIPVISEPPPGYEARVFSFVSTVKVRGRKDIVNTLQQTGLRTETIDIRSNPPSEKDKDWTIPSAMARIPSEVEINGETHRIWPTEESIPVRIDLTRISKAKTFTDIPIHLLVPPGFPYKATLHGEQTADVTVQGPPDIVDAVTADTITLYAVLDKESSPSEIPQRQPLKAHVEDLPGASELFVRPVTSDVNVKISEPPM
jgi:hypothetical protein